MKFIYFFYDIDYDILMPFVNVYNDESAAKYIIDCKIDLETWIDTIDKNWSKDVFKSYALYRDLSTDSEEGNSESVEFMELLAAGHEEIVGWAEEALTRQG